MKISGPGSPNFISGNYRNAKVNAYTQSQSVSGSDKATLSEEAVTFSKIYSEVKESVNMRSAEDLARIAEIKERVQSGTYNVSSADIADSVIQELYG